MVTGAPRKTPFRVPMSTDRLDEIGIRDPAIRRVLYRFDFVFDLPAARIDFVFRCHDFDPFYLENPPSRSREGRETHSTIVQASSAATLVAHGAIVTKEITVPGMPTPSLSVTRAERGSQT